MHAEDVQGLYLNIRYDGKHLSCITGTSFKTFTLDKSLEHAWDEMVQKFLKQIDDELMGWIREAADFSDRK